MEDLIKTEFTSPMVTFESMDTSTGAYYQHSPGSSPIFESSPEQSPNSFEFSQNYPASFDSSPQYFMPSMDSSSLDLSQSSQYQLYPQEFVFSSQPMKTFTSQNILTQSNLNVLPEPELNKSQIALNELNNLFSLADKTEDKRAIQARIKHLLFEHLNSKSSGSVFSSEPIGHQTGSSLITPPLSPNADNILFVGNKSPVFVGKTNQGKSKAILSPNLVTMSHPMVKVEPHSQSSAVQVSAVQPQTISHQKIARSYLGALDTTAVNVIGDSMVSQSPIAINSSSLNANNNAKIYFETNTCGQIVSCQSSPVYSYKVDSAPFPSIMANCPGEDSSIEDDDIQVNEPKPSKTNKSKVSKAKQQKGKGKLNGETKQSMGNPKQSQKRSAHLSAEFRYRTKLNDKISKLRGLVGQKVHLSKSAVLTRSIDRIIKLQKLTLRLHESNLRLQSLVAKYSNNQANSLVTNCPSQGSSTKLMSIKELARSLPSNNTCNIASNTIDQLIDMNKYLDQQVLIESSPIPSSLESIEACVMQPTTEEVFDFDQLLDQF